MRWKGASACPVGEHPKLLHEPPGGGQDPIPSGTPGREHKHPGTAQSLSLLLEVRSSSPGPGHRPRVPTKVYSGRELAVRLTGSLPDELTEHTCLVYSDTQELQG